MLNNIVSILSTTAPAGVIVDYLVTLVVEEQVAFVQL
jgi:hypothetical protein